MGIIAVDIPQGLRICVRVFSLLLKNSLKQLAEKKAHNCWHLRELKDCGLFYFFKSSVLLLLPSRLPWSRAKRIGSLGFKFLFSLYLFE
jgi:hypothetical protein